MSGRDVGVHTPSADSTNGAVDRAGARHRRDGLLIAAIALCARLVVVAWAWTRIPPTADGSYYHTVAQRIAGGHGYTWLWGDGAVTYAAHYPVGYPALIAAPYAMLGANSGWAMALNALIGAAGCFAVHRILVEKGRRIAAVGALGLALHVGLIAYTPALMTEGIIACSWVGGLWFATRAAEGSGRGRWLWLVLTGLLMGAATLVRPQSVLLAPVLGWACSRGAWRERLASAAVVTGIVISVCVPWTLRNCSRMGRCAFVSVNGGWNLLIGTQPEGRGAWSEVNVPRSCRTVFDEAGKDRCFGDAARDAIAAEPVAWLSLIPSKLNVTFDYCGAGGWYLHQANAKAFTDRDKVVLGTVETVTNRIALLIALLGAWLSYRNHGAAGRVVRGALCAVGSVVLFGEHATFSFVALVLLLLWRKERTEVDWVVAAAVAQLALVHSVFFGAGRYQLVLWPLLLVAAAWRADWIATAARKAWRRVRASPD